MMPMAAQIEQMLVEREREIVSEAVAEAAEVAKREFQLFKFELFYGAQSSKRKQASVNNFVRKERAKAWENALKEAKGNFEKAISIFYESY